jgi:hypothetical protein
LVRFAPLVAGVVGVLLAGAVVAAAVEPSLEVEVNPRKFGIEDVTHLTVRLLEPTGTPTVEIGELHNLEVLTGPSTKTEFSWINGVATRAVSYTYVLQGLEIGDGRLGPVTVQLDGHQLQADALSVEIVPGSIVQRRQGGRRSPAFDPFEDLFGRRQPARSALVVLRQLISDRQVVLGQPVIATIVLDTTASAPDAFEWATPPAYPKWWAQRIEPPERITGELVEVDGTRFNRFVVARHVLVPLKTGRLAVPEVAARVGFRNASVFGPAQVVERATEEIGVEVAARPQPPEGYAGAVGDLRYTASIEPAAIDFGESAVLTIALEGNGNLPLVEDPPLWPSAPECESYPPEEEDKTTVSAAGIRGRRIWRTTLVPRTSGEIELQPVVLAVYDPAAGRYRSQTLGPLQLSVQSDEPTPLPTPLIEDRAAAVENGVDVEPEVGGAGGLPPSWRWIVGALVFGLVAGAVVPIVLSRRRGPPLPAKNPGESPAERARQLQVALERWWLDARMRPKGAALEPEMLQLRRELEAIRFAPGRADHSETVVDIEERLRRLLRRA